jgi:hypothetical protein
LALEALGELVAAFSESRRRYPASLRNFFTLCRPLAAEASPWDVSLQPPVPVISWQDDHPILHAPSIHAHIQQQIRS